MKFSDIVKEIFITEAEILKNHNSLLLLDIDDTLVKAKNIFIHRKLPTDKTVVKLTPAQFAKESVTAETEKYYDYKEFRDPKIVAKSISTGTPILSNLKLMDSYIKNGWKLGILTARGMEDVVSKAIKGWLKFKDKDGNLIPVGDLLPRERIFAVNDEKKVYKGKTTPEKKNNVIKSLASKYDRIVFLDDDLKNIKSTEEAKEKEAQRKSDTLKKVYTKLAKE